MDGQLCPASNGQQLRVVQQLLWDVISLHLYPPERDEIRRALGNSLLDENESLFAEAGALADILGDVQLNTAALLARHTLCSNPQRNMVETEIRLLIERLHASASASPFGSSLVKERDPEALLPRSGRRDKALLDYVTTVAQIAETGGRPPSAGLPPRPPSTIASSSSRPGTSSRPPTALSASASISLTSPLSRPGTASPTLQGSRPSTAASAASSAATSYTDAPSVVAGVADKLNVSNIDAIREMLRTALLDERAALLEDIEYLQGLLEAEADLQVHAAAPPPSLAELRDYSGRLAAVVANEEARVEHEVRVSAMFAAAEQQSSKAGRLRGMVDASRRPVSGGIGGGNGTGAPASASASPPGTARRSSVSGGVGGSGGIAVSGGGGGGAQTLVVHGGDEDAIRQSQQRQRLPLGSLAPAAAAAAPRVAQLSAVRRLVSGDIGTGVTAATVADPASPLRSALPPSAATAAAPLLRAAGSLPGPRLSHSPSASASAEAAASYTKAVDSNGQAPSAPVSSRLLHSPSPGRLRPVGLSTPAGAMQPPLPQPQTQTQQQEQSPQLSNHPSRQPHSYRDMSPARRAPPSPARVPPTAAAAAASTVLGSAETTAAAAAAATSGAAAAAGVRPVHVPRSGSVGRASAAAAPAATATAAVTAASIGSSNAARPSGRVSSSAMAGEAARLGGCGGGAAASSAAALGEPYPTAVQPRALMGNKQSVVERLDEEVDKVKGGVAAILERYNIRPSTPSSAANAAMATATTAAVVARPPAGSRGA